MLRLSEFRAVARQFPVTLFSGPRNARCLVQALLIGFLLCCLPLLPGCKEKAAPEPTPAPVDIKTFWLREATPEEVRQALAAFSPAAQGLKSWNDLAPALTRSLEYTSGRPADKPALTARIDGKEQAVLWSDLTAALTELRNLLPRLEAKPELLIEKFRWFTVDPEIFYTGYYEPVLAASRTRAGAYQHPIYKVPPDLRSVSLGDFQPRFAGETLVYRLENGKVLPYYDRRAIDQGGALAGKGLEIAYASDPFAVFVLHIQGSGRLRFPDGSEQNVLYAGKNGRQYRALGAILRENNELPPGGAHMPALREWVARHPAQAPDYFYQNPSYVFFRLADDGPIGSMNKKLTPLVSLATDRGVIPLGSLLAYSTPLPEQIDPAGGRLAGIGLAQDTGGAIKGRRIDLFCGNTPEAEALAGYLDKTGQAWLLLRR